MSVYLADVERELAARISSYQPLMAARLAQRFSLLPDSELALLLSSEAALVRAIDDAVAQELQPKVYRCVGPTVVESPASVRVASPVATYRAVRPVSPLPSYRAVSPLPSYRAVSPLPATTVVTSPVVTSPIVGSTVFASPVRKVAGYIPGLQDFLADLGLSQYYVRAGDWAASMGAVQLSEIIENQVDFADSLGLRPLERSRLFRDGPVAAASLQPRETVVLA